MTFGQSAARARLSACAEALGRSIPCLERSQCPAGCWFLPTGPLAPHDRALLHHWLGLPPVETPDSSPSSHSGTVRLYAALKLAGRCEARLRERIASGGGLEAADAPTRRLLERLGGAGLDLGELAPARKPVLRFLSFSRGAASPPSEAADPFSGPLECTAAAVLALPPGEARERGVRWLREQGSTPDPCAASFVREALGEPSRLPLASVLKAQQPADGSWQSSADHSFLRPTCLALRALRAAGHAADEVAPLRATEWLRSVQNADGGWGETLSSGGFQEAASNPAHTAFALLGLLAGSDCSSQSVRLGLDHLLDAQSADGSWPGPAQPWAALFLAEWVRAAQEEA